MDDAEKVAVVVAAYLVLEEEEKGNARAKRKRPNCWVNPYLKERAIKGRYVKDYNDMMRNPSAFHQNFHMSDHQLNYLFDLVEPLLEAKKNTRPDAIPLKAKFSIVLEYLASGDLQRHVGSTYRISNSQMGRIIDNVCDAIYAKLSGEFPTFDKGNMLRWADEFMEKWNFPNCVGAIDGKHVAIRAPPNSGSAFYNYKGFHSIILLGVCDASYRFTYIDVGAYGSEGDMNAFSNSSLGKALLTGNLEFPADSMVNGVRTPYYIIGDDAFPLQKRLMKPYGSRRLTAEEQIFNYRLSRARRCIENAFGILSEKWMAVQRTLLCHPDKAQKIVTACCYLHNYLIRTSPSEYVGNASINETLGETSNAGPQNFVGRLQDYPKYVRDNLKDFVNSEAGSVPWQ